MGSVPAVTAGHLRGPDDVNDQRPSVYREDGRWIVRGSSFGSCTLNLARCAVGLQGEPFPQSVRDAMDFGTANEHVIIDRLIDGGQWMPLTRVELSEYGTVDDSGQVAVEVQVGKKLTIRLHPDGIVQHNTTGERRVLEVKCMSADNRGFEKMYHWQFALEQYATGLPLLLVVGWKDPGVDEIRVLRDGVEVRADVNVPYTRGHIMARGLQLAKLFDAAVDGDWGAVGRCDREQYPCPFYQLHDAETAFIRPDTHRTVQLDLVSEAQVSRLAGIMEEAKGAEKAAKVRHDDAKEQLFALVPCGSTATALGWTVTATETHVEESTSTRKAHDRKTLTVKKGSE